MNKIKKKKHAIKPHDSQSNQELNTSQAIFVGLEFKNTVNHFSSNKSGEIKPCFQEALTEPSMQFSITAKEITRTTKLHLFSGSQCPSDSTKWKMSRPGVQPGHQVQDSQAATAVWVHGKDMALSLGRQNWPETVRSHGVQSAATTVPVKPVLRVQSLPWQPLGTPPARWTGDSVGKQPRVEAWCEKFSIFYSYSTSSARHHRVRNLSFKSLLNLGQNASMYITSSVSLDRPGSYLGLDHNPVPTTVLAYDNCSINVYWINGWSSFFKGRNRLRGV